MTRRLLFAGLLAGLVALAIQAAPPPPAPTTFAIDSGHSSALFRVRHLDVGAFWGRFNEIKGQVVWDDANPGAGSVEVEIPVGSVDSNDEKRDQHLKSPDFFNVRQFPVMSFKSTKIEKKGERFHVTGQLMLRGKTKTITAEVSKLGEKDCGKRFGYRAAWEATFTLKRTDFGMSYGVEGGVLSDEVRVTLALEGVRK